MRSTAAAAVAAVAHSLCSRLLVLSRSFLKYREREQGNLGMGFNHGLHLERRLLPILTLFALLGAYRIVLTSLVRVLSICLFLLCRSWSSSIPRAFQPLHVFLSTGANLRRSVAWLWTD